MAASVGTANIAPRTNGRGDGGDHSLGAPAQRPSTGAERAWFAKYQACVANVFGKAMKVGDLAFQRDGRRDIDTS